jgi:hypothetical protein
MDCFSSIKTLKQPSRETLLTPQRMICVNIQNLYYNAAISGKTSFIAISIAPFLPKILLI